jgi:Ceramidase
VAWLETASSCGRGLLLGFAVVVVVFMVAVPPIPQDLGYHDFADRRSCLGVPNCLNVASNLPFLVVGLLGFRFLTRDRASGSTRRFLTPGERQPYWLAFVGIALTGIGSAYYHWSPDNSTLFWDRLPMTIAFMALLSSIFAERVNLTVGLRLLGPLLVLGVLSTLYWHVGETLGMGDLRPYALVQFGSLVAIPLMIWLFPPRYTGTADLVWVLGWYGLAKVFEYFDRGVFHLTGISGHTLKHLASGVGAWWILRMLERRSALPQAVRSPATTLAS